jgi:glycine cleavage system aminomethyltransferase T
MSTGSATNVGEKIALDAITGRATQTARTMYLALLVTPAPTDATTMSTMTELTTPGTNGYSRQTIVTSTGWSDPTTTGTTSNTGTITFGPFSSDLGTVIALALVSTPSGTAGELVYYWNLTAGEQRDPANNDSITIAPGALVITAD